MTSPDEVLAPCVQERERDAKQRRALELAEAVMLSKGELLQRRFGIRKPSQIDNRRHQLHAWGNDLEWLGHATPDKTSAQDGVTVERHLPRGEEALCVQAADGGL